MKYTTSALMLVGTLLFACGIVELPDTATWFDYAMLGFGMFVFGGLTLFFAKDAK